ncbi:MAG: M42 family metallopeptidase [Ruminococcaceae bacterium]|nr:M42 family metallopeptidase [Oscillospiraceae bacterium]
MDNLKKLLSYESVSGYEYMGALKTTTLFEETGAGVFCDKFSNIFGVKNKGKNFKVMVDAHFDTIGLIITEIHEGGFLSFAPLGGVDVRILPAMRVDIIGKEKIPGVIGVKPPHLLKGTEKKAYKLEELFIDTGYTSDELSGLVSPGDVALFNSEYTELLNGRIASAGLDDKIGVYMVSEILKGFCNPDITLTGCATTGEEIGLKGAKIASNSDTFDLCIVIDVTHGRTPDGIKNRSFPLGEGPVITLGPSLSKEYNDEIISYARKNNISLGIEVEPGNTGTNAWAYHSAGESIPTVMISIPLRYMHTSYEVCDKKDILSGISLITGYLNSKEVL